MSQIPSKQLEQFLKQDPQNINLLSDLSDAYLQEHQLEKALDSLINAISLAPNDQTLKFKYATCLMAQSNFGEALQVLAALTIQNPGIFYNRAYCHFMLGEYQDSIYALAPLADQLPQAKILLARNYHHLQQLGKAIDVLADFQCEDENMVTEAQSLLSILLMDNNQLQESNTLAMKVLELAPENAEANLVYAHHQLLAGDVVPALQTLSAISTQSGIKARVFSAMAFAHMMQGELASAQELQTQALALMPEFIGAYHALAWTQLLLGQYQDAQNTIERALAINRNVAESHGTLAVIYVLTAQDELAHEAIRKANKLDADNFSSGLAKILIENNTTQAQTQLLELMNKIPLKEKHRLLASNTFLVRH